jgi:hypothetical protein
MTLKLSGSSLLVAKFPRTTVAHASTAFVASLIAQGIGQMRREGARRRVLFVCSCDGIRLPPHCWYAKGPFG